MICPETDLLSYFEVIIKRLMPNDRQPQQALNFLGFGRPSPNLFSLIVISFSKDDNNHHVMKHRNENSKMYFYRSTGIKRATI